MRLFRLLIALSVLLAIQLQAQNISMDEAIKMALGNNPELQKINNELNKTEADRNESFRLPNPVFNYSRESLNLNNNKADEWITSGTISLNFLWDRWSNINSKEIALEVQLLQFENSKRNIIYQVKSSYTKYYLLKELTEQFADAYSTLDRISNTAINRAKAGDISEYESQRILIEVNKLKAEIKGIELDRNEALNSLKLLIGSDAVGELTVAPVQQLQSMSITELELLQFALTNRSDLKAIDKLIESEKSSITHSKLKAIPNVSLTAGYKKQLDNYSGSVFQLNFEIPLFKRNQIEIEKSESELNYLDRYKSNFARQVNNEVRTAYTKYIQYSTLLKDQNEMQLQNIFSSAVFSYEQGDISVIELIDGLNAFKEGLKLSSDIQIKHFISYYELENVTALKEILENN